MIRDSIFTVENTTTGEFRTFRLETQPPGATFAPGRRVLYLLNGPENKADYKGFAFVDGERVHVWKGRKAEAFEPSQFEKLARFLEKFLRVIASAGPVSTEEKTECGGYRLLYASPCSRCGELMTVPDSIRRGIGPVCVKRQARG